MYEIATLKTKKLPELQEIAKKIGIKKTAGLKKLDLIYQIVDLIASKPDENTASKFDSNNEIKEKTDSNNEKKTPIKVLPVQKLKNKTSNDSKKDFKTQNQIAIETNIITIETIKAVIVNQILNLMVSLKQKEFLK